MRSSKLRSRSYPSPRLPLLASLLLLVLVLSAAVACTDSDDDDQTAAGEQALAQTMDDSTVLVVGAAAEGEEPAPLANAAAVFAAAAPAIAVVETPSGAATGVVIEGGFVVTNAGAVWPHRTAAVRLAGGTTFPEIDVVGIDRLIDLAVLGPLPNIATAFALPVLPLPAIGSQAFLIGFSSTDASVIQPSISEGLVSGQRRWEPGGLTFLQSDAPAAAGQLGGALVTDAGRLVGLAGPSFGDDRITNFAAIADLAGRIVALASGESPNPPGAVPSLDAASPSQLVSFFRGDAEQIYLVAAAPGDALTVSLDGNQDGALALRDADGVLLLAVDETAGGLEVLDATLVGPAPYVLVVGNPAGLETQYELIATAPLALYADAEDGQTVEPGDTIQGAIDAPGDSDAFRLELLPGQSVAISASSLTIDTVLTIEGPGGLIVDDDSGGGPLGTDAATQIASEDGGSFLIRVGDVRVGRGGPYALSLTALSGPRPPGLAAGDDAVAAAGPLLPAGRGLAVRGDIVAGLLTPRLVTIDAQPGERGASQIVDDADGDFQVTARLLASDGAQADLQVTNANGDLVTAGVSLAVTCTGGTSCVGSIGFSVSDDDDAGPWTVELIPVDGAISGWQLEVARSPEEAAIETLPAQ